MARSVRDFGKADLPAELEEIAYRIIGAAMEVHSVLGPGLIESVYERALKHELGLAGLRCDNQVEIVTHYKGIDIRGQRADLVVEGDVLVELKAVESIAPVHRAQLLSYLRASSRPLGLLINFNQEHLRDGIARIINERSSLVLGAPSSPSRPSR